MAVSEYAWDPAVHKRISEISRRTRKYTKLCRVHKDYSGMVIFHCELTEAENLKQRPIYPMEDRERMKVIKGWFRRQIEDDPKGINAGWSRVMRGKRP